jgi:hypothetical protein
MCLCGLFSYFDWGKIFFTNPTDVLHLLVAWKFILSFDGLIGYEEGKLLARVTMVVLRLVQMITYLKDGSLYWVLMFQFKRTVPVHLIFSMGSKNLKSKQFVRSKSDILNCNKS